MIRSISAGDHRELLASINELNLMKEQIVNIVPFKDLLIAFYYDA